MQYLAAVEKHLASHKNAELCNLSWLGIGNWLGNNVKTVFKFDSDFESPVSIILKRWMYYPMDISAKKLKKQF